MKNRIKQSDLENLVTRLNELTGNPLGSHTQGVDGRYTVNIGNYHLDHAYGGVKLVQTVSESGGVRTISSKGYGTKRQCYDFINAFIAGIKQGSN